MPIQKLKGCAQMIANMLGRDKTPVRTEAAEELKGIAASVESEFAKLRNDLAREKRKSDDLKDMLKQARDFLEEFEFFTDNEFSVKRCPTETVRDKFVQKINSHLN